MLEIKNLQVNYGYIKAVKGIDIKVGEGKIISILGANGAGKTSTLKAISGIIKPSAGQIIFNGEDISNLSSDKIVSRGLIHCPEGRKIFPELTVEENLKVGAYIVRDKKIIKENFQKVYQYFPRLLERKKQMAGTLSGGEQQMLALGRGIMANPKLLILDEPSLGLAPIIVGEIFNIIKKIKSEGVTILLVEQNAFQALKISDYSYVLETGKIRLEGKSEEIRENEDIKKSYLGN
ncbi:ABC transporter ATP-binding protein [Clostridium sp. DL1XJH146]